MVKKILFVFAITLSSLLAVAQQDAQYSQYMFNGIYINPAYAGYKEQLNVHSFYRNQWTGITGAPKSMSLAVDAIANSGNVGLAFQVASDKLGAQNSVSAYANYAYRLRVGKSESSRLALGVGVGVLQQGIDGNNLNARDEGDNFIPIGNQNEIVPDARAGVFYSDDRFYAGFSADNLIAQYILNQRNLSVYFQTPKTHFYFTAGMLLPINESVQIKPSFLLKDDRGGPTSLDINAFVLLGNKIWVGGSYRTAVKLYNKSYLQSNLQKTNSAVGMVEFFATNFLRLGYAYDQTLSSLAGYSGGSHEISVGFTIKPKKGIKMLTPRYF
ncbi:PorP/SprF family type IX secretion system membrane protein [Pedobacter namyangjuensis]|uniref:PorP/SprF family type IX secretion system membrane protein n=1 Tax=Pedobacter namyangjuensis TaxID=600626 RepID=UPI000DE3BA81|nr:type IX secretion system membrane protein PorP/SprF [Pedobacter namyangjuensis]